MTDLDGFAVGPGIGIHAADRSLKASRESTGGALSVFELGVDTGPPLHVHDPEHECLYALEGELAVCCGDDTFRAAAGSFVFLPIGREHRFWSTSGSARALLIVMPGGIEDYFHEINAAASDEPCHQIAERYGIRAVPEAERYGWDNAQPVVEPPAQILSARGAELSA